MVKIFNPCQQSPESSFCKARKHQRLCFFQCSDSLPTSDAGELLQELVKRFSAFQVVQKILKRDTRAAEDRLTAKNLGVLHDDAFRACGHCKPPASSIRMRIYRLSGKRPFASSNAETA